MNTVLFIHSHEPERCPNCGHIEDTVTICKHCKYEYPESKQILPTWLTVTLILLGLIIFIILLTSFIGWSMDRNYDFNGTYIEYLKVGWKKFIELLKDIV